MFRVIFALSAWWIATSTVWAQGSSQSDEAQRSVSVRPIGAGGGAQADFDSLIDLITATIAPDTWDDVGGDGSIQGFPGGVYVDAAGVLRQLDEPTRAELASLWTELNLRRRRLSTISDVARRSPLRKISLGRLLVICRNRLEAGRRLTEAMTHLAGLERIDYMLLDPRSGDCVLAGPADGWQIDRHGRHVARGSGRPVVRLEDLVVLVRNAYSRNGRFICAITPTREGLAQAQRFVYDSSSRPVPAGQRQQWLREFGSALGLQRIEVEGIDPHTRVARILVEADHHMKQIGIGLRPGTDVVPSYLDRLVDERRVPEQMDVLRWWFTIHRRAISVQRANSIYAFGPQAVQVLSENELLTQTGQRVHTGQSDPLNERFASDFTADFLELARRYPIYADLDNIFRLSLVANLIHQQRSLARGRFDLKSWLESDQFPITTGRSPTWVSSIVNYRQLDRRTFVAAVSGGVEFRAPRASSLPADQQATSEVAWRPPDDSAEWWWD